MNGTRPAELPDVAAAAISLHLTGPVCPMEPLKLAVFDAEDLAVVSAHLQEAVARVGDIAFLPGERRFALVLERLEPGAGETTLRRRPAGLHFERVLSVRTRGIDRADPQTRLTLLAVLFQETDAPSGVATLHFEGGASAQLDVECLEAAMKDLDEPGAGAA